MRLSSPLRRTVTAALTAAALAASVRSPAAVADVVAVVSAKSPITALSKDQVADIFLGRTSRFPNGNPAVPIDLAESSTERDEFYVKFAGKQPAQVKAHWSKVIFTGRGQPPPEVSSDLEVKKRLTTNPNAIGYVEQAAVDPSIRVVVTP